MALTRRTLCALIALAPLCACDSAETPRPRDVMIVVIDTARARQLGSYGYDRATTPFLDSLAAEGVVFERASSTSSYTRESIASLFTGLLPSTDGAIGWWARPSARSRSLAQHFRRAGYFTALVTASEMIRDARFFRGFNATRFVGGGQDASGASPAISRVALELAREARGKPLFLYAHYLDPHAPYEPPDATRRRLAGKGPSREAVKLYGDVREDFERLVDEGFGPGDSRFEDLVARYDGELAESDAALRALVEGLAAIDRMDRALLVVTADHGEEFLEHGFVEHAWTLYEESLHVPLVFHAPDLLAPARVSGRASLVDVPPSLFALLGIGADTGDGESLFGESGGRWLPRARAGPVYAELGIQNRLVLQSVTDGDWKYIAARRWLSPAERSAQVRARKVGPLLRGETGVDPWGPIVREELYNLRTDPGERSNRASETERLEQMRRLLEVRRAAARAAPREEGFPAPLSEEERERLEALGYL